MDGIKHIIECHCVLPQYRHRDDPVYHKFIVFSVIDDSDTVVPKHSQCNNCGVVHKVIDLCRSEILAGRDELKSVISIDDLKIMIPEDISRVLDIYDCDLATWENVLFILQNKKWGASVIVAKEELEDERHGKRLTFTGPGSTQIEPFTVATNVGEADGKS
jgi:hypothetical protein